MNEEEIINRIKYRVNELKLAYAIDNIDLEAIQGLLNLYNQEKEKNKKLESELDEAIDAMNKYYEEGQKYIKVIDIMAEDICIYATENHYSAVRSNFGNDSVYIRPKETMKEYYFKKARGEEDE